MVWVTMKRNSCHTHTRKVLFIDAGIAIQKSLRSYPGWEVDFCDFSSALCHFLKHTQIRVVVVHFKNDQVDDYIELARTLKCKRSNVMIIGLVETRTCFDAIPAQCLNLFWDFYHLPIEDEHFFRLLGHAYGLVDLATKGDVPASKLEVTRFVAKASSKLRTIDKMISEFAAVECPVLISGETGTGKGLCAQMIHERSARSDGPMISINCGALSESLIQSELFGHVKGAFTGAYADHVGHIERAHKGTLFLDEIADLSSATQVQLLHFLETKEITKLGCTQPKQIDCRLIFASHVELTEAVAEGLFREDLYYRLAVLTMKMPSFRDLGKDRITIANHYVEQFSHGTKTLSNSAKKLVNTYSWPGNVRELKNKIQRACVMTHTPTIFPSALGICSKFLDNSKRIVDKPASTKPTVDLVLNTLNECNNNISKASRKLNISRTTFYRILKSSHSR